MALIVQTDAGDVADANAYITAAEFREYHDDRSVDLSSYPTRKIEAAIINATDYLDGRWQFVGERRTSTQRTAWPRTGAEDESGRTQTGIPVAVKEACAEYALVALTQDLNPAPTHDATGRVVQSYSKKVGPIEKRFEFTAGAPFQLPRYPAADQKLRAAGLVSSSRDIGRA